MIANRNTEIRELKKHIRKNHIDTYGSTGIGKSALIKDIFSKFAPQEYFSIHIELQEAKELNDLLEKIAEQFDEIDEYEQHFYNFSEYIYENKNFDIDYAVNLFSAALHRVIESTNVLLCLDGTEKITPHIWETFEEKILRFHINEVAASRSKLKIITIGQEKMQWYRFPMKNQLKPYRLGLLEKDSTGKMIQLLSDQNSFMIINGINAIDIIYQLTLGHPKSIEVLVQHWTKKRRKPFNKPLNGKKITYEEGLNILLTHFIHPEVINKVRWLKEDEHYPSSESLLSFLQYLAPLRSISSKTLREALRHLFPDFCRNKKAFLLKTIFHILQKDKIMEENELKKCHNFPIIIRHILLEDLRRNDSDKLITCHQKMSRMYQGMIEQGKKINTNHYINRHIEFIEKLYHIISWQQLENKLKNTSHDTEKTLNEEITKYLKEYSNDITFLKKKLEKDNDFPDTLNWKKIFTPSNLKKN